MFDFFQKPADLGSLPKEPVRFINALLKRKHWRKIQPSILHEIAKDTEGKHQDLLMFAFISELCSLVKNNYVRASERSNSKSPARVEFGYSLHLLGVSKCLAFHRATRDKEVAELYEFAHHAFAASILCDPMQIVSYAYIANLHACNKDIELARESCEKFRNILNELMSAPVESLSIFHQSMRMELESPERLNQFFNNNSSLAGRAHNSGGLADIKRHVEELDKALREFDPKNPNDYSVIALRKAVSQML
jgi:hypothetical protein